MLKYFFAFLFSCILVFNTAKAQHEATFETKDFPWNGIVLTIAEETEILKNTTNVLELKVQQQHLIINKQSTRKAKFSKALVPFSKKYKIDKSKIYIKETEFFNAAYLFRAHENKFTVSILLQKKSASKELFYLDMYTNTLIGQLNTEHEAALKYMVEMLINNLKTTL